MKQKIKITILRTSESKFKQPYSRKKESMEQIEGSFQ